MPEKQQPAWDISGLAARIERRRQTDDHAPAIEDALLAYVRWKSAVGVWDIAAAQEKEALDRVLDSLEPERWQDIKELVDEVDNRLLLEVMHYSSERALEESREMVRELEALRDEPDVREPDDEPDDEPSM